jgi:hypothetical protein
MEFGFLMGERKTSGRGRWEVVPKKPVEKRPYQTTNSSIRSRDALIMRFICYDLHINFS